MKNVAQLALNSSRGSSSASVRKAQRVGALHRPGDAQHQHADASVARWRFAEDQRATAQGVFRGRLNNAIDRHQQRLPGGWRLGERKGRLTAGAGEDVLGLIDALHVARIRLGARPHVCETGLASQRVGDRRGEIGVVPHRRRQFLQRVERAWRAVDQIRDLLIRLGLGVAGEHIRVDRLQRRPEPGHIIHQLVASVGQLIAAVRCAVVDWHGIRSPRDGAGAVAGEPRPCR